MSKEKNSILFRTKIIFAILVIITIIITTRLVVLKISQPLKDTKSLKVIVPERGNIFSSDNEIIAISLKRYNVLLNFKTLFSIIDRKEKIKSDEEFEIITSKVFNELIKIFPQIRKRNLINKFKEQKNIEKDNRTTGFEISQWGSAYDISKWNIFLEFLADSLESDKIVKKIIEKSVIFKDFKDISTTYYDVVINYESLFKEKNKFSSEKEFDDIVGNVFRHLDNVFLKKIKEKSLINYFQDQKKKEKKDKEYLIKDKMSYYDIKNWENYLFSLPKNDTKIQKTINLISSSIVIRKNKYNKELYMRKNPFKNLAIRTIGNIVDSVSKISNPQYKELYDKGNFSIIKDEDIHPYFYQEIGKGGYGLEKFYNNILQEKIGIGLHKKIDNGTWTLLDFGINKEAERGQDIYSSINISYQNFVDSELKRKLYETDAEWGTAILMEVNTGKIRAIANLGRQKLKDTILYEEDLNYAAGNVKNSDYPDGKVSRPEPGSTFKLASLLVALEDYDININDSIDCEKGEAIIKIGKSKITVNDPSKHGKISIKEIFEKSSNIGMSKLIDKYYQRNPKKFYKGLHNLYLDTLLGVSIPGERKSNIVTDEVAYVKLSHGYGWEVSPLQIITLYNAIANNGEMLKPLFIDSIKSDNGKTEIFQKEILNPKVCSDKTLKILQELLIGAVQKGTGYKIKNKAYLIAGKTGTSQINYREVKNDKFEELKHYGSFVGYFPADNPKYTLYVGIYKTRKGKQYYGGDVAAPVFGNIADKIYSINPKFYSKIQEKSSDVFPNCKAGNLFETNKILSYFGFPSQEEKIQYKWGNFFYENNKIKIKKGNINNVNLVPNVYGMCLRDALNILEERGLRVKITGKGLVVKQSIKANNKITKGQTITLILKN